MQAGPSQPAVGPSASNGAAAAALPEGLDLSNLGALAAMLGVSAVTSGPPASAPGVSPVVHSLTHKKCLADHDTVLVSIDAQLVDHAGDCEDYRSGDVTDTMCAVQQGRRTHAAGSSSSRRRSSRLLLPT